MSAAVAAFEVVVSVVDFVMPVRNQRGMVRKLTTYDKENSFQCILCEG